MKPVIAPVNFSGSSRNAAAYAANLASAIGADLILLHILQLPLSNAEAPMTEQIFEELQDNAKSELENLKSRLEAQTWGKTRIFTQLETGTVESQLEEVSIKKGPFAVVMGIKKKSAERLIFGSNVLFALQRLEYPLLVIPEDVSYHTPKKIVLAYDLEGLNKKIPSEFLKELKQIFNSSLDVLIVNTKKLTPPGSNYEFGFIRDALQDIYPSYHFKTANSVEEGIIGFLAENNPDLLILLPKRHSIFEFHKSHTRKMTIHADIPILSIHE